jgi:hypothetical protein
LYTNIPTDTALVHINHYVQNDNWGADIIQGLKVILKNNYFEFGDSRWLQLQGTAMGTSVAPAFASLYLAYFEERILLPQFQKFIVYYKRFIDDGFIIWNQHEKPFEFNRFIALFTKHSKLKFTFEKFEKEAPFMDLWILNQSEFFLTRTHQKALNLYLYLPANSAHPPGVLKGLVYGLIKKYHKQNSSFDDFRVIVQKLFSRLQQRGYRSDIITPIFKQALSQVKVKQKSRRQLFFKVPFDPNGPSRFELKNLLQFSRLTALLKRYIKVDQLSVCYLKPPTLKRKLCPTKLDPEGSPTPTEQLKRRKISIGVGVKP